MYRIALLATLLPVVLATEGWRACDGLPAPVWVNITGCDGPPCDLPRGQDIYYQSMFTTTDYSDVLTTYADFREIESGIAGNFPLPSDQKNTCARLIGSRCPVYPDEDLIYELKMGVLRIYPTNMALDLKMYVRDASGATISCFQILATTVG